MSKIDYKNAVLLIILCKKCLTKYVVRIIKEFNSRWIYKKEQGRDYHLEEEISGVWLETKMPGYRK